MSTPLQPVTVLVLAGRRSKGTPDPVAAHAGVSIKAFVPINGQTMLERVLNTLRNCPAVGDIHVCLPQDVDPGEVSPELAKRFQAGHIQRVAPMESPSASVRDFVGKRVAQGPVLVTTADHPLLSVDMLNVFLDHFAAGAAEVAVAITDVDALSARYPASRRTRLHFADGAFTGCNLFAFQGPGALRLLAFWERIDPLRKKPWRLAGALGWSTLLLYLCRRLSVSAAVERLGLRCQSRLQVVKLDEPHAGIDVDKVEDLELVTRIIKEREAAPVPECR